MTLEGMAEILRITVIKLDKLEKRIWRLESSHPTWKQNSPLEQEFNPPPQISDFSCSEKDT